MVGEQVSAAAKQVVARVNALRPNVLSVGTGPVRQAVSRVTGRGGGLMSVIGPYSGGFQRIFGQTAVAPDGTTVNLGGYREATKGPEMKVGKYRLTV